MRAEPSWRVLNRGVNGERTDEIAARFDRDVLPHAPDVLILLAGVNDVYQGRVAATVQAQLAAMYARAREARIAVVACSIIPYDTATADQNARMHAINAWIRETASSTPGMSFCDTRAAVATPGDIDRLFETPDQLHPTPPATAAWPTRCCPCCARSRVARHHAGRGASLRRPACNERPARAPYGRRVSVSLNGTVRMP